MKFYLNKNVFDAALDRIRWLFDEFPNIIVGVSGGKDSTVLYHLCLQVAREKDRLPLSVLFIDQEAEWQGTVDIIREWMYNPDVTPKWYQMPIRLFNATSTVEHWLHCWDPEQKDLWVHEQDPVSVKENVYGTDRFGELFGAILKKEYPDTPSAYISGVRAEEAPKRYMAVTQYLTYKDVTWGSIQNKSKHHYTFYPIYDWSYTDVWKAIHDNKWKYNRIYDLQYQYGLPIAEMRISNIHHETAVKSLFHLQEMEPDTYNKVTRRLAGIDMAGKMGIDDYFINDCPDMFKDWVEYRDYLLDNLIDEQWKQRFRDKFKRMDEIWADVKGKTLYKAQINSILTNDWEFCKLENFQLRPENARIRQNKQGKGILK